jgi:hypothetical protein
LAERAKRLLNALLLEAHVDEAVRGALHVFGLAPLLAVLDPLFDVSFAERVLGVQTIVRAATHAEVVFVVGAAERACDDVIELEERRRRATIPGGVAESAALAVSFEDRAPRRCADAVGVVVGRLRP